MPGGKGKAVEPRLFSKPVEFDWFKAEVIESLPDSQELDRIAVPQPVADQIICPLQVFVSGDVGQDDVIRLMPRLYCDFLVEYRDVRHYFLPPT